MKHRKNKETILLAVISLVLGFTLIISGIASVPTNCELFGEDTAGLDSFSFGCSTCPQPCSNDLGNLFARILVGMGIFSIFFPLTYGFMKALQINSTEEAKKLKII